MIDGGSGESGDEAETCVSQQFMNIIQFKFINYLMVRATVFRCSASSRLGVRPTAARRLRLQSFESLNLFGVGLSCWFALAGCFRHFPGCSFSIENRNC